MRMETYNYIIYKAVNTQNNQIYIGATTNTIHQRKLDHIERALRSEEGKFQQAISTYGAGSFEWEQVDTASTLDELAQKEKQYIITFNSKADGLNSDEGGGIKKTVYQYNIKDGSLVSSYNCLKDAGNAVNAMKQSISRACLSVNQTYRGFYWSYSYKEPFIPVVDDRKKNVLQYTIHGHLLAEYESVAEASRQTKLNKSSISKVCRGERMSAGGFVWRYNQ